MQFFLRDLRHQWEWQDGGDCSRHCRLQYSGTGFDGIRVGCLIPRGVYGLLIWSQIERLPTPYTSNLTDG